MQQFWGFVLLAVFALLLVPGESQETSDPQTTSNPQTTTNPQTTAKPKKPCRVTGNGFYLIDTKCFFLTRWNVTKDNDKERVQCRCFGLGIRQCQRCTYLTATTQAPTTVVTGGPTSGAPSTQAPTSAVPSTQAPTSAVPSTQAPTSAVPSTQAPTGGPTSEAPSSQLPTSGAPSTQGPGEITTEIPAISTDLPAP